MHKKSILAAVTMLALGTGQTLAIDEARAQGSLTQEEYNAFLQAVESGNEEQLRDFLREYPDSILIDAITAEWLELNESIELPEDVGGIVITAPAPAIVLSEGGSNNRSASESDFSDNQIY